jgi:hypothetical protein
MRQPADHHDLGRGEVELADRLLRDHGHPPRGVPRLHGQQVRAVKEHPPGGRPVHPVDGLEDRRLAAPVGPEQPDELPVAHGDADVADDAPPGDVHRHAVQPQAHWVAPYR